MKFIPLCFLISLLVLFNTKPLQGAEPVVDIEGNPLQPGVGYYAWPLWANSGGITTRNKTCPLDVIRDPNSIGQPIVFTPPLTPPPLFEFVPTLTDLTIDILILGPCIQYSRTWKTTLVGSGFSGLFFVTTGGRREDLNSQFKIVNLQGDIYSIEFCPSDPGVICKSVGTYVDTDGTKVLAVGEGIDEPYYVRFQKASNFPLKMYQDLTTV